ncbi:hypothetical protein Droror1_Dr00004914 [Drosera rotundifolia]
MFLPWQDSFRRNRKPFIIHTTMSSELSSNLGTKRYAVVTGSNKGIGFKACRQFASRGVTVILTARDSKNGLEALERLRGRGLSDYAHFHQLEVTDSKSMVVLADLVKAKFGKLDILVCMCFVVAHALSLVQYLN